MLLTGERTVREEQGNGKLGARGGGADDEAGEQRPGGSPVNLPAGARGVCELGDARGGASRGACEGSRGRWRQGEAGGDAPWEELARGAGDAGTGSCGGGDGCGRRCQREGEER